MNLNDVPEDVACYMMQFIRDVDVNRLMRVNKRFHAFCTQNFHVWRQMIERDFGAEQLKQSVQMVLKQEKVCELAVGCIGSCMRSVVMWLWDVIS